MPGIAPSREYEPTDEDLALEELLEDLRRQFRETSDPAVKRAVVDQYRELRAQQAPEYVEYLARAIRGAA